MSRTSAMLMIEMLELAFKHLPGKHDQSSHTPKRYGKGGASDPKVDLQGYIEYRKSLGTTVELEDYEMSQFNEALDDITPTAKVDKVDDIPYVSKTLGAIEPIVFKEGRGYFLTAEDELVSLTGGGINDHVGVVALSNDPSEFGLTDQQANDLVTAYIGVGGIDPIDVGWDAVYEHGTIRVREFEGSTNLETQSMDNKTLRRLQRNYDNYKLHMDPKGKHVWEDQDAGEYLEFSASDFLMTKSVEDLKRRSRFKDLLTVMKMLELAFKHQPGKHDQQRHAPKRRAGGNVYDNVKVQAADDVKSGYADFARQVIEESVPEHHLVDPEGGSYLNDVNLYGGYTLRDMPRDAAIFDSYPKFGGKEIRARGMADQRRGDVYLATASTGRNPTKKLRKTLLHEVGHVVFSNKATASSKAHASAASKLDALYDKEASKVSLYASRNRKEYKAEAYASYATRRSMLKHKAPGTYGVMKEFFGD